MHFSAWTQLIHVSQTKLVDNGVLSQWAYTEFWAHQLLCQIQWVFYLLYLFIWLTPPKISLASFPPNKTHDLSNLQEASIMNIYSVQGMLLGVCPRHHRIDSQHFFIKCFIRFSLLMCTLLKFPFECFFKKLYLTNTYVALTTRHCSKNLQI